MNQVVMRQGLPAVFAGGMYRKLGLKLTNEPKPMIRQFADFQVNPMVDLATLAPYDFKITGVPVLNQGQLGDCVANGLISETEKCRLLAGMSYQAFSAAALYALVNGGTDNGADPRDAIKAAQDVGLILAADVPPNTLILASQIPASAIAAAAQFRLSDKAVYQLGNLADLVTADFLGFGSTLTINVGDNFGPDPTGLVGFTPGPGNHQVSGGQGFRRVNGVPQFRCVNSWGTEWGEGGYFWIVAKHIEQQMNPLVFAYRWALSDCNDPTNPPV